jgi:hypothetical protein
VTLGLAPGLVSLTDHDDAWYAAFLDERERIGAALEGLGCESSTSAARLFAVFRPNRFSTLLLAVRSRGIRYL